MAWKYLDFEGLTQFWGKIKLWVASAVTTNSPSKSKTVTGFNDGKMTYGNIGIDASQVETGKIPIGRGGTNATSASGARSNLDVYSKSEVDSMLTGRISVVATLPASGTAGVIYYVGPSGSGSDQYEEYIWDTTNSQFIKVGEKSLDLTQYVNTLTSSGSGGFVTGMSKNGNEITFTLGTLPDATTAAKGIVQLAGSIGSSISSENNKAASEKAVRDAINALDSNKTSSDGTNVQVKVTISDGKVSAVNIMSDNTENRNNKVSSTSGWGETLSDTKYPSEKLVKESLDGKSDTDHTHTTSLAADSGTPSVTLEHNKTYKLTAGGTSVTFKTPSDNNTDTKVKATAKTDDVEYKILATASASPTSGNATEAIYDSDVTLNPSTNTIAANISGNAATATEADGYSSGGDIDVALSGKAPSSHTHGNITNGGALQTNDVTIASGDKLVITDASNSNKVARASVSFDAATTSKALTPKGTFESFQAPLDTQTAYTAKGSATKVPKITTNALGQVTSIEEVSISGVTPASHSHGNITNGGAITADGVSLGSGDSLAFVDSSDSSKIKKSSITFDGSTATKALTQKGTWETFNNYVHPTTSGNKHIPSGGSSGQFLKWSADGTASWSNLPTNPANGLGYCLDSRSSAVAAITATCSGFTLKAGGIVAVKMAKAVVANATLSINGSTAAYIFIHGAKVTDTTKNEIKADDIAYFIYDGTQFQFLGTDRMEKDSVTGFADVGTAGTTAKVQYTKGDGSTGDLMVAITNEEIELLP